MSVENTISLRNPQVSPANYCSQEKYLDHQLEQYKLYVETTEKLAERRTLANTFFLTLHTLIIGIAGFSFDTLLTLNYKWVLIIPLISVLTLCYGWRRLLRSYKQISAAKFRVIDEFEKYLPARPFVAAEWKELGYGKDPELYKPLTDVETWIPIVFGLLYIVGVGVIWLAG